jgi:hypothetical protein
MKKLFKIHIIKNFIIAFTLASTLAFTLTSTLVIISTSNANANMFNRFKKGFYFEKYSTAEEAKAALLELHPIGSDVEGLVKTLERAGGKCNSINKIKYNTKPINLNYLKLTKIINCKYQYFYSMNWEIGIMCINNLIDDIGIHNEYTGL